MNKVRLYWLLQITGWSMYAFVQIVPYEIVSEKPISNNDILFYIVEAISFLILTHIFRTQMIRSGWLALPFNKLIPRSLLCVLLIAVTVYFIRIAVAIPLGVYRDTATRPAFFLALTTINAITAFVWTTIYLIYHYFERYNLSLKRQAAMHEIELNNLKSQLNPHFIFNSLNSIRALVDENPVKSKNAITQLSLILRSTLVSDQNSLTNFGEELETVKNYLGLESMRYEERLRISMDIDPGSFRFMVPPLMLQTLVENGIKHGISSLKEGGVISLKTVVNGDHLRVEIRNSGKFKKINGNTTARKVGLGLKNTRKRLELIYGDGAKFDIRNEPDNIVVTKLVLPKNTIIHESNNS